MSNSSTSMTDEALLLHRRIVELRRPNRRNLMSLNEWMQRDTMGNVYLSGIDRFIWKDTALSELVTLESPSSGDITTSRFTVGLVHLYHVVIGRYIHVSKFASQLIAANKKSTESGDCGPSAKFYPIP